MAQVAAIVLLSDCSTQQGGTIRNVAKLTVKSLKKHTIIFQDCGMGIRANDFHLNAHKELIITLYYK